MHVKEDSIIMANCLYLASTRAAVVYVIVAFVGMQA